MAVQSEYRYRGMRIRECMCERYNQGKRWFVQTYHSPTGIPWSESECRHYVSLNAARAGINEGIGGKKNANILPGT